MPHMMTPTPDLRPGDVVRFYGARYQLRADLKAHHHADSVTRRDCNMERPVYTITGDRIDTDNADMPRVWHFQGNSRALWHVEP